MEKRKRNIGIIYIALFALCSVAFLVLGYINNRKRHENLMRMNFHGIIENASYDIKGYPTISVNQKVYYLNDLNAYFNHKIETGDTIVKKSGSMIYILTKKGSRKQYVFGSNQ